MIGRSLACFAAIVCWHAVQPEESYAKRLLAAEDSITGKIEAYHLNGSYLGLIAQPGGIIDDFAVSPAGEIYVSAGGPGNFVRRYSATGAPLFPPIYDFPSQYWPIGLAFDAVGRLYVGLNSHPDRIDYFSSTGASLGTFANIPPHGQQGGAPFDLEFDSNGRLYAPNVMGQVERYDVDGTPLGIFTTQDPTIITDLSFDSLGNLYTLGGDRVAKFDTTGAFQGYIIQGLGDLTAMVIDENDVLYLGGRADTGTNPGFIKKFSPSGAFLGDFKTGLTFGVRELAFAPSIPEPAALVLAGLATLIAHSACRRRSFCSR